METGNALKGVRGLKDQLLGELGAHELDR